MFLKSLAAFAVLFVASNSIALPEVTYFHCEVKEDYRDGDKKKTATVNVYFAVAGLNPYGDVNELIKYPGADEDAGYILVEPEVLPNDKYTFMSNLNGQGGDLRMERSGNIRLFGDGDGYQFTDLVLWTIDGDENDYTEGYVRDYGAAWEGEVGFKQFITCKKSDKVFQ